MNTTIAECSNWNISHLCSNWNIRARCSGWNIQAIVLVLVDCRVGVVVAPVEPVIFQRRDAGETFSLGWAGGGAALEVPLARGGCVEQRPLDRKSTRLNSSHLGI